MVTQNQETPVDARIVAAETSVQNRQADIERLEAELAAAKAGLKQDKDHLDTTRDMVEEEREREEEERERQEAERERQEAERARQEERQNLINAEKEAREALTSPAAQGYRSVIEAQNKRQQELSQLEEQYNNETDEAKRQALKGRMDALGAEIASNAEAVENATNSLNVLTNDWRSADAGMREMYQQELENARSQERRASGEPSLWERYAPSFLGGWKSEDVEKYDASHPKKEESRTEGPSLWERYAPTALGGWSSEDVEKYDASHPKKEESRTEGPSLWERYAPTALGGWSREDVEKYDTAHPKKETPKAQEGPTVWERYAPTVLGGKEDHEIAAADMAKAGQREVLKGVTVDELRDAGYSSEQIQSLDTMAAKATVRAANASRTLGQAAGARLTEADYQEHGFNQQDMAAIYNMSRNGQDGK